MLLLTLYMEPPSSINSDQNTMSSGSISDDPLSDTIFNNSISFIGYLSGYILKGGTFVVPFYLRKIVI